MADLKDVVQKAFHFGVGLAAYASEKASRKLLELQTQAQKLADEMVSRGAMSAEEARQWVENVTHQASTPPSSKPTSSEPRQIEILVEEDDSGKAKAEEVEKLRQRMLELQAELHRLQEK